MLTLRGVSKSFNGQEALAATDLALERSRTTVLIGPSGCGKSTLLRLMVGLVQPDEGSVHFGDREMTRQSVTELRRHIGYVIQDGGLFPHLTARENISIMARYINWADARVEERIAELAALTRFPVDALDRYPVQISGGQRQRVSLMRALMLDPDVLLLDEPLGALDPLIRSDLQQDLREIFVTLNKTVVLVTHDLSEAALFADAIVLLRDGRIVQAGALSDLLERPVDDFVRRFVTAQRNLHAGLAGS